MPIRRQISMYELTIVEEIFVRQGQSAQIMIVCQSTNLNSANSRTTKSVVLLTGSWKLSDS